jgi:hypothetical protein
MLHLDTGETKTYSTLLGCFFNKIGKVIQIQNGNTAHSLHASCQTPPLTMSMIKSLSQHNKLQ